MTKLSWLIYITQICDNIHDMFRTFIFLSIPVIFVFFAVYTMSSAYILLQDKNDNFSDTFLNKISQKYLKYSILFCLSSTILNVILPYKESVLLIIASEYGEELSNNSKIQGPIDPGAELIKTWFQTETAKLKNN